MGILYTNIRNDNSLEFDSEYKTFSKREILEHFEACVYTAGAKNITWFDKKETPYKCSIRTVNKHYTIFMYLKNISGAGWETKPWIKRVQVPNIRLQHPEYYVDTLESQTLLIVGYYNYDNNPILVAWDAYGYVMHSTLRSCYVEIDDLIKGYKTGYYEGECSGQKIWVFRRENFFRFLDSYIKINNCGVQYV